MQICFEIHAAGDTDESHESRPVALGLVRNTISALRSLPVVDAGSAPQSMRIIAMAPVKRATLTKRYLHYICSRVPALLAGGIPGDAAGPPFIAGLALNFHY